MQIYMYNEQNINILTKFRSKGLSLRSLQDLSLLPHTSPSSGSRHWGHSDELAKTSPQVNAQVVGDEQRTRQASRIHRAGGGCYGDK